MQHGQIISHYKILRRIGDGGMGIVYCAEDTRLQRTVALKVLRPETIGDPHARKRFLRGARAASPLNHPNITTIYDIDEWQGQDFIAMEFVEGKTVKETIKNSKLKIKNVVDYAVQIAEALQEAHEHNIIHRDIKSENIMITAKDRVKVMDFGLAKMPGTVTKTQTGTTMGTIAYMSPEQTRGDPLDGRTDIWSLGVVLYEMLTGELPFKGDYDQAVIYSILNEEPENIKSRRRDAPDSLVTLVEKALSKNRDHRFHSANEFLKELRLSVGDSAPMWRATRRPQKTSTRTINPLGKRIPSRSRWIILPLTLVAAVTAISFIFIIKNNMKSIKLLPQMETKRLTGYEGIEAYPALSPDGHRLAFTWAGEKQDNADIYIKLIGFEERVRLTKHPDMDYSATWSADGNSIAFIRLGEAAGLYHKNSYGVGDAKKICNLNHAKPHPDIRPFVDWSPDGQWLAFNDFDSLSRTDVIYKLDFQSRVKEQITFPNPEHIGDTYPRISPDGNYLAYARVYSHETRDIYILNLKNKKARQITADRRQIDDLAWTSDSKKIIFVSNRDGIPRFWSVQAKGGEPQPLDFGGQNANHLSISRGLHRLVFSTEQFRCNMWQANIRSPESGLIRFQRLLSSSTCDFFPVYSPNGQKIAFNSDQMGMSEICTCNFDGTAYRQLTDLQSSSGCPRWSPDGKSLLFDSKINGDGDILIVDAGGSKQWRNLTDHTADDRIPSWSRDGQSVYFGSNRSGSRQIHKMPASGGESVQLTQGGGNFGYESFDGLFLFYINLGEAETSGPIYQINLQTKQESIAIQENIYAFRWAVNPEGVYYIVANDNKEPVLKLYRYPERTIEQIGFLERWCLFSDVSDDGKIMLLWFSEDYSGDIYMVDFFE
jgi:serine/threonine protein kinase